MSQKVSARPQRGRGGLRSRLLLPVVCVMLLQSLLHIALLWQGGVVSHADSNTYDIFSGRVNARAADLEGDMRNKWSALSETEYAVIAQIEATLSELGAPAERIGTDAALNTQLVDRLVPQLIYLLRKNMVTGAFLVLDGPGLSNDTVGATRAGFYLRDLDPASYSVQNTDLMVARGMPEISKRLHLAFDTCWTPAFRFPDGDRDPAAQFFFKPLNTARQNPSLTSAACGYWSPPLLLEATDIPVITYTIPIRLQSGQVVGVLGVDVTESFVQGLLPYDELLPDKVGAYSLGLSTGGDDIQVMVKSGPMAGLLLGGDTVMHMGDKVYESIRRMEGTAPGYGSVLASSHAITLYDAGSPYEGEVWTVTGFAREDDLLSFSRRLTLMGIAAAMISLVLGVVGVYFATMVLIRPLSNLVGDLRHSDPSRPVHLNKLGIVEIDELTDSIETLSASVAESASKISKILNITQAAIGVYEYGETDEYVFLSGNLPKLMGWPGNWSEADSLYLPKDKFLGWMKALEPFEDEEGIYQIGDDEDKTRYIKLTQLNEGGKTLGTVSDVTRDVLEKRQIEYERDYDLLTGLYNRRAFSQRIGSLFTSGRDLGYCAMIMWDLDDLKYVNDTYGHDVGDRYIMALAECLKWFPSQGKALAARRSGDEFCTFVYGYPSQEAAQKVVDEGWARIKRYVFALPGEVHYGIHVSGGVAWYPQDAQDWQELMRYADYAMYDVKHNSKGNLRTFVKTSYLKDETMLYGIEALNKLVEQHMARFALQPIYDVVQEKIYGYEMLMRPLVKELRTVQEVLRLAQTQARLYQIERLTWFGAMKDFAAQCQLGGIEPDARVFINSIAGQRITDQDRSLLEREYGPYLSRVVMEITDNEPGAVAQIEEKTKMIGKWQGRVAIDDYGAGYNSEASLIFLSLDIVKLDMSIVRGIDHDRNRQDLLASLMAYAKTRGVEVVAEGVETEAEMRLLVASGVNYLQGYYIARPALEAPEVDDGVRRAILDARDGRAL